MRELLDLCKKHNIWLMGRRVLFAFTYGETTFSVASLPIRRTTSHHRLNVEDFCMTGWRLAIRLLPRSSSHATVKLQNQSTSNPTSIAQYAALAAMTGPMDSVPVMLRNTRVAAAASWTPQRNSRQSLR